MAETQKKQSNPVIVPEGFDIQQNTDGRFFILWNGKEMRKTIRTFRGYEGSGDVWTFATSLQAESFLVRKGLARRANYQEKHDGTIYDPGNCL